MSLLKGESAAPAGTHLVPLFTARYGAGEGLLVAAVHAHGAEDGLGADGALSGPRLVTVRLLVVHLLLVILTACSRRGGGGGGGQTGTEGGRE